MRTVDDLVNKDFYSNDTVSSLCEKSLFLTKEIERLYEKTYQILNSSSSKDKEGEFTFIEKIDFYDKIKDFEQRKEFLELHDSLKEYISLRTEINSYIANKENILLHGIDFRNFGKEFCYHQFVSLDDELFCSCCDYSFKDYQLSKKDLLFLISCAEKQGIFIKEVENKNDLPLLKVLQQEWIEYRKKRAIDSGSDDYFAQCEEIYLMDESEISEIRFEIRKAHELDSLMTNRKSTIYLDLEEVNNLLEKIKKEEIAILNSNSKNKEFLLWECRIAYYEVLLLSGKPIPLLWDNFKKSGEDESIFVSAIYRLSTPLRRENTTYFKSDRDAWNYECRTSIPEINEKILIMKK